MISPGRKRRRQLYRDRREGLGNMKRLKELVILRDGNRCKKCGKRDLHGFDCTLDHIKPFFLDGTNDLKNLRILCAACHTEKTNFEVFQAGVHKLYTVIFRAGPFALMKRRTDVHA